MKRQKGSLADRSFRTLMRILPFDFRVDFDSEMEQVFRQQRADAERHGHMGLLRLWWETILGIFATAPREHWAMVRQDAVYALRMMSRNLGYTTIAVVTLALGIGANTAIFSIINATLLQPLPYRQGNQLAVIHQMATKAESGEMSFSVQEINDYRNQNQTLSGLVEYHSMTFTLLRHGDAQRVATGVVSWNFFDLFGVQPVLGRSFVASDELPNSPPVLILSYEYWQRGQHGDPDIVGKTFEMNDKVHTVIGVLPPVPQYPDENDVYMTSVACPFRSSEHMITDRDMRMMHVFGRLKPGVTQEQSSADLAVIAARLAKQYPKSYPKNAGYTANSTQLRHDLTSQARPTLFVLLAAAVFVLLIACANVANLILARMARRERELVVRSAMGAGKSRLLRQLLTESALMGLIAGVLGLLMASGCMKLLVAFAAQFTPRAREITMDGYVLLFALIASVGTSIVFGSASALFSREDLSSGLKEGTSQATVGRTRQRMRSTLIVAQVAFSFVLLTGAGLMLRSLAKLQQVDAGYMSQHVINVSLFLNWAKYKKPEQFLNFSRRLIENLHSQPGVISVATSSSFPLDPDVISSTGNTWTRRFTAEGQILPEGELAPVAAIRVASSDYFKTLGIPVYEGRSFAETDDDKALPVAIVNLSLARHQWKDDDPVGKRITFDKGEHWITIAGVVGDVKEFGLDKDAGDELYLPMAQTPALGSLLVRTAGDPVNLANTIRRAIQDLDPETAVTNVETLEQARSDSLTARKLTANFLGLFAALALVIAVAGIGGILALSVSQRVHEIGIRVALGARPWNVLRMIIGQGMMLVAFGLGLGLAGAFGLTRLLKTFLFEVTPTDPVTFGAVALVLAGAAFVACYVPARRAARIDPISALRCE
ncbi:MAG TPA: ABC transporter permease [Terriglobia bacterium]|nr:ABC transporter permease [Terriglobia bacterium]